jgi:hypothetical protein
MARKAQPPRYVLKTRRDWFEVRRTLILGASSSPLGGLLRNRVQNNR